MADDDCDFINVPAETPLSPEEAIIRRHRKEKRDLQGKIQSLKKNVNKADKKKKKDLADEITKMEMELEARHKAELDAFVPGKLALPTTTNIPETIREERVGSVEKEGVENGHGSPPGTPKVSKARRRREKKEAEEREKQKRIASEASVLLENSQMKAEDDAFVKLMEDLKLQIVDIEPDGNCLYNAVKDQLRKFKESTDALALRKKTAEYLKKHKDEYMAFMEEEYNSEEGFQVYCDALENTSAWGGQLEVRILSQILERPITVVQSEGSPITFGENFTKEKLVMTYHRYKYQLGEHYNSTQPVA